MGRLSYVDGGKSFNEFYGKCATLIKGRRLKEKEDKEKTPVNMAEPIDKVAEKSVEVETNTHQSAITSQVNSCSSSTCHMESSVMEKKTTTSELATESLVIDEKVSETATVTQIDVKNSTVTSNQVITSQEMSKNETIEEKNFVKTELEQSLMTAQEEIMKNEFHESSTMEMKNIHEQGTWEAPARDS